MEHTKTEARKGQSSVDGIVGDVVGLARVFEPLRPLVSRSRLMSLNARMTASKLGEQGASFSVVAQALGGLGDELGELVSEVEVILGEQVTLIGEALRSQDSLRLVSSALRLSGLGSVGVQDALRGDAERDWASYERAAEISGDSNAADLWRTAIDARRRMVENITGLTAVTGRLKAALTRVERVAITRGFFVGTNARIEASRLVGNSQSLEHLAMQLDGLAEEIAQEIRKVTRMVGSLEQAEKSIIRNLNRRDRH